MAVRVRHQFVGFLRRRVQADRMIDRIAHGKRQLAVGAVHRTRRRVDQMLDAAVTARFEDVDEADEIGFDIRVRILDRVAHAGLRGEIDDALRLEFRERFFDGGAIFERRFHEPKARMRREPRETRFFQLHVVIGVEVVEAEHLIAARQQPFAQVRADEARRARDQYPHRITSRNFSPLRDGRRNPLWPAPASHRIARSPACRARGCRPRPSRRTGDVRRRERSRRTCRARVP